MENESKKVLYKFLYKVLYILMYKGFVHSDVQVPCWHLYIRMAVYLLNYSGQVTTILNDTNTPCLNKSVLLNFGNNFTCTIITDLQTFFITVKMIKFPTKCAYKFPSYINCVATQL